MIVSGIRSCMRKWFGPLPEPDESRPASVPDDIRAASHRLSNETQKLKAAVHNIERRQSNALEELVNSIRRVGDDT